MRNSQKLFSQLKSRYYTFLTFVIRPGTIGWKPDNIFQDVVTEIAAKHVSGWCSKYDKDQFLCYGNFRFIRSYKCTFIHWADFLSLYSHHMQVNIYISVILINHMQIYRGSTVELIVHDYRGRFADNNARATVLWVPFERWCLKLQARSRPVGRKMRTRLL